MGNPFAIDTTLQRFDLLSCSVTCSVSGMLCAANQRMNHLYEQFCFKRCENDFPEVINLCMMRQNFLMTSCTYKENRTFSKVWIPWESIEGLQCNFELLVCTDNEEVRLWPIFETKFNTFRPLSWENPKTFFPKKSRQLIQRCFIRFKYQDGFNIFFQLDPTNDRFITKFWYMNLWN